MKNTVMIMMATYNGERYLRKQLESIQNQTWSEWQLYIQDDGSTDGTYSILQEYAEVDPRIHIRRNPEKIHGSFTNFHILSNYCKTLKRSAYYCFADQDDVWFPKKLETMISALKGLPSEKAALVYADMALIDGQGKRISDSIDAQWKISGKNCWSFFWVHKVFGCNLMMNSFLFFSVPILQVEDPRIQRLSHDNLYAKFAAVLGRIIYLPEATMEYRRSGKNVTADQKYTISLGRILQRIFHLKDLARRHVKVYNHSLTTISLLRQKNLTKAQRRFLNRNQEMLQKGGWHTVRELKKQHVNWGGNVENISHELIIGLRLYIRYLDS